MSNSGRRKPPLVAEKRYSPAKGKKKPASKKPAPSRSRKKSAKRKPAPQRRGILYWLFWPFRLVLRIVWGFGWRAAMVIVLLMALSVGFFYSTLPEANALLDGRARGSVTMLDRNGDVFAWRGDQFGGVVTTDTVSPHLKNAVIATEDKRFYRHFGLSPRGIASAVRINLREGRGPLSGHGGSTITQQTAKLLCLGVPFDPASGLTEKEYEADCRRGTIWRKIKEALYAMAMETK
jgi:membrane peptidoglycan carboxypeptidase